MKTLLHRRRIPTRRTEHVLDVLTQGAVDAKDIDTLLNQYLRTFCELFGVSYAVVVFRDSYHETHVYGRKLARSWMNIKTLSAIDEQGMKDYEIAEILPLEASTQQIGLFVVGRRKDKKPFSSNDCQLLAVIGRNLSVSLLNMFRLEEIRRLAGNLEDEVNDATKKLRASNRRLKELDATKDEFVSMASHQLRTPLTSVKGYLSMVLEGDAGEITDFQRQLLEQAFQSSERMVRLVGDFLNVNRLQTGKFMIDRTLVDLSQIVADEVADIDQVANAHKEKVIYRKPARFPMLYLDDTKIRQVIMNFIDNAIYYSPDADEVRVELSVEDGEAVLKVIDKGIGVPASDKKRLGTKFFRSENARTQRPDGTGIGLYLARKVIEGHGGKLVFESTEGKGSTFGFRLPIKLLKQAPGLDDEKA